MRVQGTGYFVAALDLGFEIDLARAGQRLGTGVRAGSFKHKRSPEGPPEEGKPLRFTTRAQPVSLGTRATSDELEIALYTFGAISLAYALPLELELAELVETCELLYGNAPLLTDARVRASELLALLGDAVREPHLAESIEDYVIYSQQPDEQPLDELEGEQRALLARILRAERGPLAQLEIDNALAGRIAYAPRELVLVDWFAALLIGADMEDERRVLELTTVELCELRFLDARLERRVDEAYGLFARRRWPAFALAPRTRELERLARFQADSAILHENFDNALKLLADDYLARLYELCSDRFHFSAWDMAIERKLGTLESIYSKMADQSAHRRAELLEWIIIALFVVDILLYFSPFGDA
jgi:hypothetical protein